MAKQGIRKKLSLTRNCKISILKCQKNTNLLPEEATHTTLDLLGNEPLLINFDKYFVQYLEPSNFPDLPLLELEVLGDMNSFIGF